MGTAPPHALAQVAGRHPVCVSDPRCWPGRFVRWALGVEPVKCLFLIVDCSYEWRSTLVSRRRLLEVDAVRQALLQTLAAGKTTEAIGLGQPRTMAWSYWPHKPFGRTRRRDRRWRARPLAYLSTPKTAWYKDGTNISYTTIG